MSTDKQEKVIKLQWGHIATLSRHIERQSEGGSTDKWKKDG